MAAASCAFEQSIGGVDADAQVADCRDHQGLMSRALPAQVVKQSRLDVAGMGEVATTLGM
jgi:hypothetical protein